MEKQRCYGIEPRNAEQAFSLDALTRKGIELVALSGKAGTGKTLLALAAALAQEAQFEQILLARPVVPLANRDIGFLPGDVGEKIGPYMEPLFDNLAVIKRKFKASGKENQHIEELRKTEKLLITPLAYIRGRSLSNVFFIIDEAQNLTPHEVKTIITRAGEGTKMVFTGDIQQIDSPYLDALSNGLSYLIDKMRGQELFAHVHLVKSERSVLAELAGNLLSGGAVASVVKKGAQKTNRNGAWPTKIGIGTDRLRLQSPDSGFCPPPISRVFRAPHTPLDVKPAERRFAVPPRESRNTAFAPPCGRPSSPAMCGNCARSRGARASALPYGFGDPGLPPDT